MWTFKKLNNLTGWLVWAIATIVYFATLEPSVSFWDCGEFISSGFKLEVGHPPGAPLYMLLARFFSLFAGGNVHFVAILINSLSALASSFTILFLFWSVTYISQKVIQKIPSFPSQNHTIITLTAGAIAALSYTFTDTFWFSAVEGEVYALSSLFTAVVFWAILKWESSDNKKWLILIAFLIGLSIGVHLLNLLAIPAIGLLYYYKKYDANIKGAIIALLISIFAIGILLWLIIPGLTKVAFWFDLLFINGFSLPVNSGAIFYCFLVIAGLSFGIYYTHTYQKVFANTVLLIFTVIVIGYSSYAVIIIRSLANPPMDENNPENPYSLLNYLNREQYGETPLIFGQYYNAPIIEITEGKKIYMPIKGKYTVIDTTQEPKYDNNFITFFPRMWSSEPSHIGAYKQWAGIEDGKNTEPIYMQGQTFEKPTFAQNLKFFFSYQLGHMYFRYFMWNFAGRQNDFQGNGEPYKGNWISGISPIDNARLGPQDTLPDVYKENKAHNTYFFIPFILGILGLVFLFRNHKKYASILVVLFFFTGIAIVIFLNQNPLQPRERDYAYAASFYVFCMWIGFSVPAIFLACQKYIKKAILPCTIGITALSPIILCAQNWDDHDRSGRFIAHDFSANYLTTCEQNAILFTYADNDTFPLWYLQEVEGLRTDVRVVNLSLFNADWYINDMRKRAYKSAPVPMSLPEEKYRTGTNEGIFVLAHSNISHIFYPAKDIIDIVSSNDPNYKARRRDGSMVDYIPVPNLVIPVDKKAAIASGIVSLRDTARLLDGIPFSTLTFNSNQEIIDSTLSKSRFMLLDILANFNWQRPLYFSKTVGAENYFNMQNNMFLEGLSFNLKPMESNSKTDIEGQVNSDKMYENLMQKYIWGNCNNPDIYIDENIRNMVVNYRSMFAILAETLINENKINKAKAVLQKCEMLFPDAIYPYDYFMISIGNSYARIGNFGKAKQVHTTVMNHIHDNLLYYMSIKESDKKNIELDVIQDVGIAIEIFQNAQDRGDKILSQNIASSTSAFMEQYFPFTRQVAFCSPQEFESKNMWVFQLQGNLPYVAYWYNTMKVFLLSSTQEN